MAPMPGNHSGMAGGMAPMAPMVKSNRGGTMANGASGMVGGRGGMTMRNGPMGTRGGPMRGGMTPMTTGIIAGPLMTPTRGGRQIRGRGAQMGGGRGMQQTHMQPTIGRSILHPQGGGGFQTQIPPQQMNQYSPVASPTIVQVGHGVPRGADHGMAPRMAAPVSATRGMPGPYGAIPSQSTEQQMTAQERIIQQQQQQIEQQNQQIAQMKKDQLQQQRKMGTRGMAVGAVGGMVVAGGVAAGAAHLMGSNPSPLKQGLSPATGLQRQSLGGTQQDQQAQCQQKGNQATVQGGETAAVEGAEGDLQGDVGYGDADETTYTEEAYVEEDVADAEGYGARGYDQAAYVDDGTGYFAYQDTRANGENYGGDGYGGEGYTEEDYTGGGEEEYGGGEEYRGEEEYAVGADYGADYGGSTDIGSGGEELLEPLV